VGDGFVAGHFDFAVYFVFWGDFFVHDCIIA